MKSVKLPQRICEKASTFKFAQTSFIIRVAWKLSRRTAHTISYTIKCSFLRCFLCRLRLETRYKGVMVNICSESFHMLRRSVPISMVAVYRIVLSRDVVNRCLMFVLCCVVWASKLTIRSTRENNFIGRVLLPLKIDSLSVVGWILFCSVALLLFVVGWTTKILPQISNICVD